ncbi:hypothetical protein [Brunnivagina elsteri]|uniref:Uncharacterized protein n=1 Tax=Brunnivagina elsteri CCALA 953 TaxID=987040 RepID=A0A2A2TDF4_9CYAN|nr:hypothetical protein [Calothrix elsteri]PAX51676.1 hypothetical protein CK510_23530 [Calothrix elsteri CCALA 953]
MNIYFSDSSNINEWTEWHLTLRGWKRGSEKCEDSPLEKKVNPPIDRILTCRYHQSLSTNSIWIQKHTSDVWKTSDCEILTQTLEKFGNCPQSL